MKQSLKLLKAYTIETGDEMTGNLKDFLFDEKQWTIRYVDADFGSFFSPYKILIPRVLLDSPDNEKNKFLVKLQKGDFENCPKIKDHLPVSRKYEEELNKHYNIAPYWGPAHLASIGGYFPPRPLVVPTKDDDEINEDNLGTILRSFTEIENYNIEATDERIGHIEDLIIDTDDWQIVYAVIDTINWLPWSKKVLIPINNMKSISYKKQIVRINLSKETITDAPEYNSNAFMKEDFEKSLFDFYSQSLII